MPMTDSTSPALQPLPDDSEPRPELHFVLHDQTPPWEQEGGTTGRDANGAESAWPRPMEQPPIVGRELVSLFLIIVLCDLTIYRGRGFAGYGALFAAAPLLLMLGLVRRKFDSSCWILAPFLALTSIRLIWCGSTVAVVAGFVVLCGIAMGFFSVHPTSAEGYLRLEPLIHCQNEIIQQGIRAMLAQRLSIAELESDKRRERGWTAYQIAEDRLLAQLRAVSTEWKEEVDHTSQTKALDEFHRYAYQWY